MNNPAATPAFDHNLYAGCAAQIVSHTRELAAKGWTPATAGNFSIRMSADLAAITISGKDKGRLSEADIMVVDMDNQPVATHHRPSAETALHTHLYRRYPDVGAVLHTHSPTQTIAGLLYDLKARGLLEDTLVWWGGEFGRTPTVQGSTDGRDHNPEGFTMWLAGGGVKGGFRYGATDDYGYYAVENKVHFHDLHATILHLLGLDHTRLTYRYAGRDFRLTDVHGEVVEGILG